MKKIFASICAILLLLNLAGAQQLQQLDDTDSLKQRREKTNANFQMLLNKVNQNFTTLDSKPAINSYTRSTLPSNASVGTIATVSNDIGGVWLRSLASKWYRIGGEAVSVEDYASLSAAVSAAGSSQWTIQIPTTQSVTSNLVIPPNVILAYTGGGQINVASGVTLTIQSDARGWPLRQLFAGSGSVRFAGNVEASYPQWFGAAANGTTDDAAAIQKAIDAWTRPGYGQFASGRVELIGPMAIGSTLNLFGKDILLKGRGAWGSSGYVSQEGFGNDFIRWIGAAGSPMILIHAMGARVEGLHLIGKSSAKPSAAIEYSEAGDFFADNLAIRDVWIGPKYGAGDDTGIQFTRGIYFSGSVDADTNLLERVFIVNCITGIDIASGNSSVDHFDTIETIGCTTGLKTVAPQVIVTNWICASNDVDLDMAAQGVYVELYNYASEGSGRMAVGSSLAPYRLVVRGGGFQADGTAGGKFETGDADFNGKRAFLQFKGLAAIATYIDLHDFSLTASGTPATPIIQVFNTSDNVTGDGSTTVHLKVEGCTGIYTSTIDVGNDGYVNSSRIVEYAPFPSGQVQSQQVRFVQNSGYGSEDGAFQDSRFDLLGKVNIYGGPLKVKALPNVASVSATPTGTGATTYSYKVVALTYDGNTAPSSATCTNGTLGTGGRVNTLFWYPVPGAYAYRIYGRSSGSELLMATVTLSAINQQQGNLWIDNGSVTPSGALPTTNTTGNAVVDGSLSVGKTLIAGSTPITWNDTAGLILNSALNVVQPNKGGLGATVAPSNGQIPIGNGSTYTPASITAGPGITITPGTGSLTIAASEPYLVYTALITQSSTSAPTVTVLRNTIGTITWSRSGLGRYTATSSGAFTADKTAVIVGPPIFDADGNAAMFDYVDTNSIIISTYGISAQNPGDGKLTKTLVEIRVYP